MRLEDKVILITGGSKGLGRETALRFAKEGARVVVTGRGRAALDAVVADAAPQGLDLPSVHAAASVPTVIARSSRTCPVSGCRHGKAASGCGLTPVF